MKACAWEERGRSPFHQSSVSETSECGSFTSKLLTICPPFFSFKRRSVGAPYAIVPPNAALQYEVELIRLSARGPDELTQGISRCGAGGASGSAEQCEQIEVAEFL